ncbi:hypothetical protein J2766_000246 [Agrobacterium tumefaciens]|uniref:Uncharacterized protein n=1 Tax=Agrobacterium tumefaciens TaxID=358 RepID=A0AAW8LTT9_AGRTU|nr:hypothetical protein [Agrobacterium tumefaciens]MBP2563687.1 hypothetical protein [Agrobacterium tumefaciens]MDR6702450.1 hypothetical protein [Agrobacterium tumefaciens]
MKATTLLQAVHSMGRMNYPDASKKWITVMHQLGSRIGLAHGVAMSSVGKLDMMLRQLESEHLEELALPEESEDASFITDQISVFSDSWLLAAYEVIRAARAQGATDPKIVSLYEQLTLARIPVAKAEISGADRYKNKHKVLPNLMLYPVGDGPDNSPKAYAHDGSYIVPKGVCAETGAIVWYPIDLASQQTVAVCRRDLSDSFLGLFD